MTNPEPLIPPPRNRRPTPEPIQLMGGQGGRLFILVLLAVACGGAAAYMALVQHMPLTDMRVVAPAIGAMWFGLRIFMNLTPKP
jgi:hypothetical protein